MRLRTQPSVGNRSKPKSAYGASVELESRPSFSEPMQGTLHLSISRGRSSPPRGLSRSSWCPAETGETRLELLSIAIRSACRGTAAMHFFLRCRDSSRPGPWNVAKLDVGLTRRCYASPPHGRVQTVWSTSSRIGRAGLPNNQERLLEPGLRVPQMAVNNAVMPWISGRRERPTYPGLGRGRGRRAQR